LIVKYDVVLISLQAGLQNRVRIMQAIMVVNPIGLKRSKDLADNPPAVVLHCVSEAQAEEAKAVLEKAGGTVELRPAENCE
jgi:large subunit ribosomal protein L7/L12